MESTSEETAAMVLSVSCALSVQTFHRVLMWIAVVKKSSGKWQNKHLFSGKIEEVL